MLENKKIIALILIAFTAAAGSIAFTMSKNFANHNIEVLYISKAELLSLEKNRLEQEPLEKRQLFFGKPKAAAQYLEEEQKKISKTSAIVLLTDSKIYGGNVRSISKEVHSRIIENLKANSVVGAE